MLLAVWEQGQGVQGHCLSHTLQWRAPGRLTCWRHSCAVQRCRRATACARSPALRGAAAVHMAMTGAFSLDPAPLCHLTAPLQASPASASPISAFDSSPHNMLACATRRVLVSSSSSQRLLWQPRMAMQQRQQQRRAGERSAWPCACRLPPLRTMLHAASSPPDTPLDSHCPPVAAAASGGIRQMTVQELQELLADDARADGVQFIDVRAAFCTSVLQYACSPEDHSRVRSAACSFACFNTLTLFILAALLAGPSPPAHLHMLTHTRRCGSRRSTTPPSCRALSSTRCHRRPGAASVLAAGIWAQQAPCCLLRWCLCPGWWQVSGNAAQAK